MISFDVGQTAVIICMWKMDWMSHRPYVTLIWGTLDLELS